MKKQVWELTEFDIADHPVWVFPMSDVQGSDEATVAPANEDEALNPNTQVIVAAEFTDGNNVKYSGYIHWAKPISIEVNQPLMWVKGDPVGFWFGTQKPRINEIARLVFPIRAVSKAEGGLEPIEIVIPGYGYITEDGVSYVSS